MLFLLVFGILGIQLFKGQLGYCNDGSPEITHKQNCTGYYLIPVNDRFGNEIEVSLGGEWNITNTIQMTNDDNSTYYIKAE